MKKIFQTLGKNKATEGTFGIEIECEGVNMQEVQNKIWKTENDGSLRGRYPDKSAEFVLQKPIHLDKVRDALESLVKSQAGAEFNFSFRTSVHVHVNVSDFTHTQMLNMVYTYLLLEEPLMTYCGKERKGNRFCLRIVDAEGLIDVLRKLFRDGDDSILHFNGDNIRYSGINIAALQKYGSLEFRGMRGNMDVDVIETWVKALNGIREFALKMKCPRAILEMYQNCDAKEFMSAVLGDVYPCFTYPRMVKEIQRSFSLSLDLPYAYVAPAVEEEAPKPVKKPARNARVAQPIPAFHWNNAAAVNNLLNDRIDGAVGNWQIPVRPIQPEGF